MVKEFVDERCRKATEDVEKLLNKNRIFVDRTKGVGAISREEAIAWSLTGPDGPGQRACAATSARTSRTSASPDNWDGQGAKAVDFKVPVMTTGDVYARYLVRLEEMKQSLHIIRQLIDNIPGGPGERQPRGQGSAAAEGPGLQQHRGADPALRADHDQPRLRRRRRARSTAASRAANGELGYYIVSAGENVPWRVRTRPPCTSTIRCSPS